MIVASVALLLVSVGLLTVGLVTGATPLLLASVVIALAALAPLGVAVVRARPPAGDRGRPRAAPTDQGTDPAVTPGPMDTPPADPVATDPAPGGQQEGPPPRDHPTA